MIRRQLSIPEAPQGIQAGSSLATLLGPKAIDCLAANLASVHKQFPEEKFRRAAMKGLRPLALMDRGRHIARVLHEHLPGKFENAVEILLASLTPPVGPNETCGLAGFFYLPHTLFVANYGLSSDFNGGRDPFRAAMRAQRELTRRFTAEFSIRPFLIHRCEETLAQLLRWTGDPDTHVRRLCSEGSRPRLPWGMRLPAFVRDPSPTMPILEALKDDSELYVRRSVANHLGDIGKDHPDRLLQICTRWLRGASTDRRWLIRHALRYPARKGVLEALALRSAAGGKNTRSSETMQPPTLRNKRLGRSETAKEVETH